jgi:hypothetical protein
MFRRSAALLRWTALGHLSALDDPATPSGADALALEHPAGARRSPAV